MLSRARDATACTAFSGACRLTHSLAVLPLAQIYGKTHYHLEGPSYAKELVVMIHGVGDYSYRFELMANAMNQAGYRTLRFDFFGRGFSEHPDDCRFDVDMYVGHVQSLLQRLELADMPVTVVGHSMGGLVAMSYCELYPDLVEKLVLLAPAGVMGSSKLPCCFSATQRFFQLLFCLVRPPHAQRSPCLSVSFSGSF